MTDRKLSLLDKSMSTSKRNFKKWQVQPEGTATKATPQMIPIPENSEERFLKLCAHWGAKLAYIGYLNSIAAIALSELTDKTPEEWVEILHDRAWTATNALSVKKQKEWMLKALDEAQSVFEGRL